MTNNDLVRLALSKVSKYDGCVITDQISEYAKGSLSILQIRRSMRDMKGVVKIDTDTWRVKGRKTPERTPPYIKQVWDSSKLGTYRRMNMQINHNKKAYVGTA